MVTEKFYVGYTEINNEFKLSNVALLNYFQDITTIHGKLAGDSLKDTDYGWFLTAYHVKVFKRPEYENWFNLSTWSREIKGFIASREFEIKDNAGNSQVSAISNWVRINKHTQKIERVSPEIASAYGKENNSNIFADPWISKIQTPGNFDFETKIQVNRNYIDVHKHVNNVSYLKLAELVLPESVYNGSESNEFDILYKKAVRCGEVITCQYLETDEYYIITIKNEDKSELCAIVRLYKK